MSGGLLAESLARETGKELTEKQAAQMKRVHAWLFRAQMRDIRLLPGAKDLMDHLTKHKGRWAVATSGALASARPLLELVVLPAHVPVIAPNGVRHAEAIPVLWVAAA